MLTNRIQWISLLIILIGASIAQAATYYVSSPSATPAGSDSNAGTSLAAPFATVDKALNHSGFACGDTLIVVANAFYAVGDANFPTWTNCSLTSVIESSNRYLLTTIGWRTNPANDSANYGKLAFNFQGLNAQAEVHGMAAPLNGCTYQDITVTIANPGRFSVPCTIGGMSNGDQVELEVINANPFPTVNLPTTSSVALVFGKHYYVKNCTGGSGCGTLGASFELENSPGSGSLNITACDSSCQGGASGRVVLAKPVMVNTSTGVLTSPDDMTVIGNNTPIMVSAAGLQSYGTLPTTTPTQIATNTIYYAVSVSGRTLKIALTLGGSPLNFSDVGTGMVSIANANVPHNWRISGLELAPNGSHLLGYLLQLGGGTELGTLGMPSNMEVDRLYMHGNDTPALGGYQALARCISENGVNIYVHDSYCAGATYSEAQGIFSMQSRGAVYRNNFIEGTTENSMCGGYSQAVVCLVVINFGNRIITTSHRSGSICPALEFLPWEWTSVFTTLLIRNERAANGGSTLGRR